MSAEFVSSTSPYGKETETQVGNNLFQDVVAKPYKAAYDMVRALGPRQLTPEQRKRKAKNRAKRKGQRVARRKNR